MDAAHALSACKECLTLPLASKVLAIASLHVLRDLSPDQLEPSAVQLLSGLDDPYVTLNAIEAISVAPPSSSAELAKALLLRLSLSTSSEVRDSVARYLGEKVSLDIMEDLKEPALSGDASLRVCRPGGHAPQDHRRTGAESRRRHRVPLPGPSRGPRAQPEIRGPDAVDAG